MSETSKIHKHTAALPPGSSFPSPGATQSYLVTALMIVIMIVNTGLGGGGGGTGKSVV